jgi:hypothetical protein
LTPSIADRLTIRAIAATHLLAAVSREGVHEHGPGHRLGGLVEHGDRAAVQAITQVEEALAAAVVLEPPDPMT